MVVFRAGIGIREQPFAPALSADHVWSFEEIVRLLNSLRVIPRWKAGVSDHAWSLDEIIALL